MTIDGGNSSLKPSNLLRLSRSPKVTITTGGNTARPTFRIMRNGPPAMPTDTVMVGPHGHRNPAYDFFAGALRPRSFWFTARVAVVQCSIWGATFWAVPASTFCSRPRLVSNTRIIFEWLRDSFAGFALFLLACAFSHAADAVTPFEYPDLYMFWFMIGMIPFSLFANWRGIGEPITWRIFWTLAPIAAIVAFLPRDLSLYAYALIMWAICAVWSRFWVSQSQSGA